ncbi:MAG: DUF3090 family protein [Acidimicrobiia bacterium]
MSEPSFQYEDADVFTTGTVGRPGQRVFYLQLRRGGASIALKVEKQQVAAMAQYFEELMSDLAAPTELPHPDSLRLAEPVFSAWTVGPIGVAYEPAIDRVVVALEELVLTDATEDDDMTIGEDETDDPDDGRATGRVMLTRAQVVAFVEHARQIVAGGRPICRFCGRPMDPDGHPCPRMN